MFSRLLVRFFEKRDSTDKTQGHDFFISVAEYHFFYQEL